MIACVVCESFFCNEQIVKRDNSGRNRQRFSICKRAAGRSGSRLGSLPFPFSSRFVESLAGIAHHFHLFVRWNHRANRIRESIRVDLDRVAGLGCPTAKTIPRYFDWFPWSKGWHCWNRTACRVRSANSHDAHIR